MPLLGRHPAMNDRRKRCNSKDSKTEGNLKAAFAGESQANRRYLYFAARPTSKARTTCRGIPLDRGRRNRPCARPPRISRSSRRSGDRTADRQDPRQSEGRDCRRDARIHGHVSGHGEGRARPKASRKSPTGSRRWQKPSARTPTVSRRRSTRWPINPYCSDRRKLSGLSPFSFPFPDA